MDLETINYNKSNQFENLDFLLQTEDFSDLLFTNDDLMQMNNVDVYDDNVRSNTSVDNYLSTHSPTNSNSESSIESNLSLGNSPVNSFNSVQSPHETNNLEFLDRLIDAALLNTNDDIAATECVLNINDFDLSSIDCSKSVSNNDACIEIEKDDDDDEDEYGSDDDIISTNKLDLTEEEKQLFKKEGYQIPTHLPLTKNEEKILKLIRRKIRNKRSAHLSRERKKKYVDGLEKRVDTCTKENQLLQKQIKMLRSQNTELLSKLQKMQTVLVGFLKNAKKPKISTSVLFISFFVTLFIYPLFNSKPDSNTNTVQIVPYNGGNSRTLMSRSSNPSYNLSNNNNENMSILDDTENENPYFKYRYDI